MKILTRDDTEHGVEYVTLADYRELERELAKMVNDSEYAAAMSERNIALEEASKACIAEKNRECNSLRHTITLLEKELVGMEMELDCSCNAEELRGARVENVRLREALHDLLQNPFPYDLLRIRHEVCSDFKADEAAAREEMECWCSDKECMDAITAHNFARKRALDILSNVPDEVSLLASGTQACSAGDVPEVPKGQGLAPSACSHF